MSATIEFNTPYLNNYMRMVEETESPRIFHIWSAIFAISAALGRRCFLPFGTQNVFPNHYILLVGTPGTRKSTAASIGRRVLRDSTGVRFAPSDTGFQRQGFVVALQGPTEEQPKEFLKNAELGIKNGSMMDILDMQDLNSVTNIEPDDDEVKFDSHVADKHHLAIVASEFSRIIGQNNMAMMDFLGERYDGEDYEYLTKTTHIRLKNTLMNMIAATTPTSIAVSLPPQAGGQGFLSRVILVYGAKKYKQVPFPTAPSDSLVMGVRDVIGEAYRMEGAFAIAPSAQDYCISLYAYQIDTSDSRFAYYNERRFTHLLKLSMCLAASRGSQVIGIEDCEEAHRILRATELGMPDALGEFGMNPLAQLKQEILEHLRNSMTPHTVQQILGMFHREAKGTEIQEVIGDLIRSGLAKLTQGRNGDRYISATFTKQNTEDQMMRLLAEYAS